MLTISIVAISMHRLALYEQQFGLTMLRLFTTVFAAWLAVVFVVAAVHLVRRRGSLLMSIAVSALTISDPTPLTCSMSTRPRALCSAADPRRMPTRG